MEEEVKQEVVEETVEEQQEVKSDEKLYDIIIDFQSEENKMMIVNNIIDLYKLMSEFDIRCKAIEHFTDDALETCTTAKQNPANCIVFPNVSKDVVDNPSEVQIYKFLTILEQLTKAEFLI